VTRRSRFYLAPGGGGLHTGGILYCMLAGSSRQLKWEVQERREKASSAGSSRRHCWSSAVVSWTVVSLLCVSICHGCASDLIFDKWGAGWLRTADCWQTGVAVICMLERLARAQRTIHIGLKMWTIHTALRC